MREKEKKGHLEELKRRRDNQVKKGCTFAPKIEQHSQEIVAASGRTIRQRILE